MGVIRSAPKALVCLLWTASIFAADFYRVIDSDDPLLVALGIERLEELYGARILVVKPGEARRRVSGIVFHIDAEDANFFMGDSNPVLEAEALGVDISRYFPGFSLSENWSESNFS